MLGPPDTVVAAVAMHMMGDLTGQSMVILPVKAARVLVDLLLRVPTEPRSSSARWSSPRSRRPATS
jgi:hypothetical protein